MFHKNILGEIKTQTLFSIFFENRAVYEKMWKIW